MLWTTSAVRAIIPALGPIIPPRRSVISTRRTVIPPGRAGLLALRLGRGRAAGGRGARLCLLGLILGYEACFQEFVAQVLHR
jgi:hypothetical protein